MSNTIYDTECDCYFNLDSLAGKDSFLYDDEKDYYNYDDPTELSQDDLFEQYLDHREECLEIFSKLSDFCNNFERKTFLEKKTNIFSLFPEDFFQKTFSHIEIPDFLSKANINSIIECILICNPALLQLDDFLAEDKAYINLNFPDRYPLLSPSSLSSFKNKIVVSLHKELILLNNCSDIRDFVKTKLTNYAIHLAIKRYAELEELKEFDCKIAQQFYAPKNILSYFFAQYFGISNPLLLRETENVCQYVKGRKDLIAYQKVACLRDFIGRVIEKYTILRSSELPAKIMKRTLSLLRLHYSIFELKDLLSKKEHLPFIKLNQKYEITKNNFVENQLDCSISVSPKKGYQLRSIRPLTWYMPRGLRCILTYSDYYSEYKKDEPYVTGYGDSIVKTEKKTNTFDPLGQDIKNIDELRNYLEILVTNILYLS